MALVTRFQLDDILGPEIVDFAVLDSNYQILGNAAAHLTLGNAFLGNQSVNGNVIVGGGSAGNPPARAAGAIIADEYHVTSIMPETGVPTVMLGLISGETRFKSWALNTAIPGAFLWRDDGETLINDVAGSRNVMSVGTVYYFEGSKQVLARYRGDLGAIEMPYGNGIFSTGFHSSGAGFYYEGGNNVRAYWDGTWIHHTYSVLTDNKLYAAGYVVGGNWDLQRGNSFGGEMDVAGTLTVHGATIYWEGSRAVRSWWDGWQHFSHQVLIEGMLQTRSRFVSNNYDVGWSNSMGGDTYMAGRLVVAAWDVGYTFNVGGNMRLAGRVGSPGIALDTGDCHLTNGSFRVDAGGAVLSFAGGAGCSWGGNIGRPADWLYIWNSMYTYWDIEAGHHIMAPALIQTSAAAGKTNLAAMADAAALTRIRDARVQVQTWDTPTSPAAGGNPEGNAPMMPGGGYTDASNRSVGFTADQMALVVPEVVVNDASGVPAGIEYSNLVALLWGALRALDARVTAGGIP